MLRDASHQQVIQKFSFIESLNLSRNIAPADKKILERIDRDKPAPIAEPYLQSEKVPYRFAKSDDFQSPRQPQRAFNFVSRIASETSNQKSTASSAIVTKNDRTPTINSDWYQSNADDYRLNLAEIVKYSAVEERAEEERAKSPNYLGKILFALAFSYCIFALWWLFGDRASSILTTLMGGKQIAMDKSDIEFIEYMEQSVSAIESRLEAEKEKDEEREVVYIPVYTPNSTPPTFPPVSSNSTQTTPAPAAVANPQPDLTTEALKIPAPPPLPAPTPLPKQSIPATANVATVNTQPAIEHTLIGILELGENRTAALIKVNGQTRRFWLGEKIGNSEWILESVTHNSAKISYGGQTRSVGVGETF